MSDLTTQAQRLHRESIVIDCLNYRFGGWDEELEKGGQAALNVTANPFDGPGGFTETVVRVMDHRQVIDNSPKLKLVRTAADIESAKAEGKVGIIIGFQDGKPVADDLRYLQAFHELGVRVIQLTYNERNFAGDGCLEPANGGLSNFGRSMVREMNRLGVAIDLSHCGQRTSLEAIVHSEMPVIFSHASARAVTNNPRNKTDDQIKALAARGGVMGVGVYGAFCWNPQKGTRPTLDDLLAHIDYVVNLVGIDHVGIGSDWPQGVPMSVIREVMDGIAANYDAMIGEYNRKVGNTFEVRYPVGLETPGKMGAITEALLRHGYKEEEVGKILGGNFMRVFRQIWRG